MLTSEIIEKKLLSKKVKLLSYKDGIIALEKASGIKSHPNKKGIDNSALMRVPYDAKAECYLFDDLKIHLLHRLDAPTSGLIILSDNDEIAADIRAQFAVHSTQKTYYAVVRGRAGRIKQDWRDRMRVTRNKGILRAMIGSGDPAITHARGVKENPKRGLTLLELKPETGRTHQLRAQCSHRRLPILGDATYGDFALNKRFSKETKYKGLLLHSAQLEVKVNGKIMNYSCRQPEVMRQLME